MKIGSFLPPHTFKNNFGRSKPFFRSNIKILCKHYIFPKVFWTWLSTFFSIRHSPPFAAAPPHLIPPQNGLVSAYLPTNFIWLDPLPHQRFISWTPPHWFDHTRLFIISISSYFRSVKLVSFSREAQNEQFSRMFPDFVKLNEPHPFVDRFLS